MHVDFRDDNIDNVLCAGGYVTVACALENQDNRVCFVVVILFVFFFVVVFFAFFELSALALVFISSLEVNVRRASRVKRKKVPNNLRVVWLLEYPSLPGGVVYFCDGNSERPVVV